MKVWQVIRRVLTGFVIGACLEEVVVSQDIQLANQNVVFGEAFELSVIADEDFDQDCLSPLVVKLLGQAPAGDLVHWSFRARCYEIGVVTLTTDPPLQLTVKSSLPNATDAQGELEWPSQGWLIEESTSSRWLILGLSLFLVGVGFAWWRSSRTEPLDQAVQSNRPSAHWDAAAALRELSELHNDDAAFYQTLKAIVRRHCAVQFQLPAEVRTSEELIAALPSAIATLGPCLNSCDVAMFGGEAYQQDSPETVRAHAKMFVEASQHSVATS